MIKHISIKKPLDIICEMILEADEMPFIQNARPLAEGIIHWPPWYRCVIRNLFVCVCMTLPYPWSHRNLNLPLLFVCVTGFQSSGDHHLSIHRIRRDVVGLSTRAVHRLTPPTESGRTLRHTPPWRQTTFFICSILHLAWRTTLFIRLLRSDNYLHLPCFRVVSRVDQTHDRPLPLMKTFLPFL